MAQSKQDRTREGEPRSYGQDHHKQPFVNLNTATVDEITALPMVGRERAERIIAARPFSSWDEVAAVEGIGAGMLDDLKNGGATIGEGRTRRAG